MSVLIMLGESIDRLISNFGISEAQFAAILGVQPRTVDRWRTEQSFPQHESRRQFDQLMSLSDRLNESFKTSQGALNWLHSESGYFGGLRPIDALLCGRVTLVEAALEAMDSGVFV